VVLGLLATPDAALAVAGLITEYPIPASDTRPTGIAASRDGSVWFTENTANRLGRLDLAGTFTEFPLPSGSANPGSIALGPDGNLWFDAFASNQVGRISLAGEITMFAVPTPGSGPGYVTACGRKICFTEHAANKLALMTTSGLIQEFSVP